MEIKLDDDVARKLSDYCRESGHAPQEVVNDRMRRFLEIEEFERVRGRLVPYAETAGYFTDEAIFHAVDEVRKGR